MNVCTQKISSKWLNKGKLDYMLYIRSKNYLDMTNDPIIIP